MDIFQNEVFGNSLIRCQESAIFYQRFYKTFLSSSEEVRQKFEHTDMQKQESVLRVSLALIMLAYEDKPEGLDHLEKIAHSHNRDGHNILPHLYDLWLDCLVKTVSECDPEFSAEVETAWRTVMKKGIDFMKSKY